MKLELDRLYTFGIYGINPEPWAVGKAGLRRWGGRLSAYVSPNERLVQYKAAVQEDFEEREIDYSDVRKSPVRLRFLLARRLEEYERNGRTVVGKSVDATNCQKALEDALQGVLFDNDRLVSDVGTVIVEQNRNVEPFILIHVKYAPVGASAFETLEKHRSYEKMIQAAKMQNDNSWP